MKGPERIAADRIAADWIAIDWGTTNLRLWAMHGARMQARRESRQGGLCRDDFASVLAQATQGWGELPVVACGMVGSREGWVEAPYAAVPTQAVPRLVRVPGQRVWIACGIRQQEPPDVMRGEETQIAGLLAARPDFDGVACMPGTHTKWARISAGELCHFQSFMTGELFALLSQKSVLRHTLGTASGNAAFDEAVAEALSQPHRAYGRLFQLRAAALVGDQDPDNAASRLSGLLIGCELAGAKAYWLGQEIAIVGAEALSALYARALAAQGVTVHQADGEASTLAGLHRAWQSIRETP
ncbi:2-dehydro-3-deoxygalactonokinase [Paracoccus salsus]|uniref:2-dehydro-3-deoxygalactonokinase n=1 Tax=Paracoccus salsus TaxID=2911061 RepID=UPI001F374801|nr:2-dehydro-3-deoxygalactonokinase [Paracoccus salsus]MCF3972415.1 2-dehydro-3-deoxygalactonokinase [Paracoccus salsus]